MSNGESQSLKSDKKPRLSIESRDVMGFCGIALLSAGAGWIFPPAGLITAGVCLSALAVFAGPPPHKGDKK